MHRPFSLQPRALVGTQKRNSEFERMPQIVLSPAGHNIFARLGSRWHERKQIWSLAECNKRSLRDVTIVPSNLPH